MATRLSLGKRVTCSVAVGGALLGIVGCNSGGGGKKKAGASVAAASSASTVQVGSGASITLPQAVALHTAVLLPSGDVFVAGGVDPAGAPTDQTIIIGASSVAAGPRLSAKRVGHTATVLESGQVLIVGGRADTAGAVIHDTTEVYDPLAKTLTPGPKLAAKRSDHVAASFGPKGAERILIAAGAGAGANGVVAPLASAEVIDPVAGKSTVLPAALAEGRAFARAVKLDDGNILIAGGDGAQGAAAAELFDTKTQTFVPVATLIRRSGPAVVSVGGEAAIIGGVSQLGAEATSDLYDMASRTIAVGPGIADARRDAEAVKTPNGIVITGGRNATKALASVEVLDGAPLRSATLRSVQPLKDARYGHSATVLSTGLVLVVGGYDASGVPLATAEAIDATVSQPATPAAPPAATTAPTTPTAPAVPTSTAPTTGTGSTTGTAPAPAKTSILSKVVNAATATIAAKPSGIGGYVSTFAQNLLAQFLGGSTSGAAGSGASGNSGGNVFTSLLGSLLGSNAPGNSSGTATSATTASTSASATASTSASASTSSGASSSSSSSSSGGFFATIKNFFSGLFGGGTKTGSTP
jgi:hypothetical protein